MGVIYVARSVKFSKWASDAGITKNVFKIGYSDDDPAPLIAGGRKERPMIKLTLVGGPTALLEYAGLRWLTDPAFSPPGEYAGLVRPPGRRSKPTGSSRSTSCCSRTSTTATTSTRRAATFCRARGGSSPPSRERRTWAATPPGSSRGRRSRSTVPMPGR